MKSAVLYPTRLSGQELRNRRSEVRILSGALLNARHAGVFFRAPRGPRVHPKRAIGRGGMIEELVGRAGFALGEEQLAMRALGVRGPRQCAGALVVLDCPCEPSRRGRGVA